MKFVLACFLLVAAVQATDWAKIRHISLTRPTFSKQNPSTKIIGGDFATVGQFKYQVAIVIDGSGFCGGSLISDTVVLTAAHCVDGARSFDVHLGVLNITDIGEDGRVTVTTRDKLAHENYDPSVINNDIGVVKLSEAVTGPNISPVRLPSRSQEGESFEGVVSRVSGWGRTSDDNPNLSDGLKFVDVSVMGNTECADIFGSIINDSKLCVDSNGGADGFCSGDSGSPLVVFDEDGGFTVIGLVSFGSSDGCVSPTPDVFTRVTSFLDWLESNAGIASTHTA